MNGRSQFVTHAGDELGAHVERANGLISSLSQLGFMLLVGTDVARRQNDPLHRRIMILMIQRAGFPNGDNSTVRKAFQEAAVALVR